MTRGQAEYLDYLRACEAQEKKPEVFICWKCQHPLVKEDDRCPQCGS